MLKINNLSVEVEGKLILDDVSLTFNKGETHAIMGRNGSGKSSLSKVLAGHPQYKILSGEVTFLNDQNEEINFLELSPEERSWNGFFLNYQYPIEIPGLLNHSFLKTAYNSLMKYKGLPELDTLDFKTLIDKHVKELNLNADFLDRSLNVGFSGGEKKRNEILQLKLLNPTYIFLDELDSGLDIDALKLVISQLLTLRTPSRSFIFITHYSNVIFHINPQFIHIMSKGKIILSTSDIGIAQRIQKDGFEFLLAGDV